MGKLWLDPVSANAAIGKVLSEDRMIEKPSPLALAKAVKVCTFQSLQDAAFRSLTFCLRFPIRLNKSLSFYALGDLLSLCRYVYSHTYTASNFDPLSLDSA